MIRLTLTFLGFMTSLGGVASAMLLPITLDEFAQHATCSCLVEITAVEEVTKDDLLAAGIPASELRGLNRRAQLRIEKWLVEGRCALQGKQPSLVFSTEIHSSRPELGHRYILMPRSVGTTWAEVIYGRSLWEVDTHNQVTVTFRNDFLIAPLRLRSGETAQLPLAAVERLLIRRLGNSPSITP